MTHEIVVAAHDSSLPHQDPADRFLAATVGVLGLTLVTADDPTLGFGQDFDTSERLIASRHAELAQGAGAIEALATESCRVMRASNSFFIQRAVQETWIPVRVYL